MPANAKVEGPLGSAPWRLGRTMSQRPRRQAASVSRTLPTIVRGQLTEIYFHSSATQHMSAAITAAPIKSTQAGGDVSGSSFAAPNLTSISLA